MQRTASRIAWLAVRAAHEMQMRLAAGSVELTGDEFGEFPDTPDGIKALRAEVRAHLETLRGKWVDCPALGRKVEIRARSIKEMMAFSGNPLKLRALAALEHIIRIGREPQREANWKPEKKGASIAYYRLRSLVHIAGKPHTFIVVIEEDGQGFLRYDLMLPKTKAALDSSAAASEPALPPDHDSGNTDDEIVSTDGQAVNLGGGGVLNLFLEGETVVALDSLLPLARVRLAQALLDSAGDARRRLVLLVELQGAAAKLKAANGLARVKLAREVQRLLAELGEGSAESEHVKLLREMVAGEHDTEGFADSYGMLQEAINALEEAGELVGEVEALAHRAITHWAEREEEIHG